MTTKLKYFLSIYFCTLIIGEPRSIAQDSSVPTIQIVPSANKVRLHSPIEINGMIDSIRDLFAASITLEFDSTILLYESASSGTFMTMNNSHSVFMGIVTHPLPPCIPNNITIDQAIPGGETVSGKGNIFTITFSALRIGISPIKIISADFRNGRNTSIDVHIISKNVKVNSIPSPFHLLYPIDGSFCDRSLSAKLVWSKSYDNDPEDTIRYRIILASNIEKFCIDNIFDTTLTVSGNVLKANTKYSWSVDATDGYDTIATSQIYEFSTPNIAQLTEYSPLNLKEFTVAQNFPNPFNPRTKIQFSIPIASHVSINIYDLLGRNIYCLIDKIFTSGSHFVMWKGITNSGELAGSGIYFYEVSVGENRIINKMVLIR